MREGYILYADILGFKKVVESLPLEDLQNRMNEWIEIINQLKIEFNLKNVHTFSDTLVVVEECDTENLLNLTKFCKALIEKCFDKSLPLRGALCSGEYILGQDFIISGIGFLQAYVLCESQNWIGVVLKNDIKNLSSIDFYSTAGLICYPVPLKSGIVPLFPVVKWDVPPYGKIINKLSSNGLGGKPGVGEPISQDLYTKISNLLHFRLYMILSEVDNRTPDKFIGTHPLEIVDLNLEKFQ